MFYPGKPVLVPDVTGDLQPDLLFPGTVHSQQNDIIDDIEVHEMDAPHKIPLLKYVPDSLKFPSLSKRKNKMKKTAINEMILLSGSTGEIVGTPLKIKQCHHLTDISNDGESIDYSCLMNSGNSKFTVIFDLISQNIDTLSNILNMKYYLSLKKTSWTLFYC